MSDLALHLDRLRRQAARDGGRRFGLDSLARRTGVPRSTLHTYLSGRSLPPAEILDRLVLELGGTGSQAREWALAWERVADASRGSRSKTTLTARSKFLSLDTEVNRQLGRPGGSGVQDVAVHERVQLGKDRCIDWHDMRMTARAVRGGVDRFSQRLHGTPWMDLDRIEIDNLVNCTEGEHRTLGDPPVRAFELLFDRTLSAGETQVFDFRLNYLKARVEVDSGSAVGVETEVIRGFQQGGAMLVIEVWFPPGDSPLRLRHVHVPSLDPAAPETLIKPLRPDDQNAAHIVVENAAAGFHGIRWEWAEPSGP